MMAVSDSPIVIIGPGNGLEPNRRYAIIGTNGEFGAMCTWKRTVFYLRFFDILRIIHAV